MDVSQDDNKQRIAELEQQTQALTETLSNPDALRSEEIETHSQELGTLNKELEARRRLMSIDKSIAEWNEMANDPGMQDDANKEIARLQNERREAVDALEDVLSPHNGLGDGAQRLIIEVRAGTGGDEAALFAADLARMYQRFAERRGWKTRVLDAKRTTLNGLKEMTFEIDGDGENVLPAIEYEGGVHRVQRVPETEKSGRIHTSTATVALLPVAEKKEVRIDPNDITVDTFRASGPGGQYVNKRDSAVRITHEPTGIVVSSQEGRSQQDNRANAMEMLRSRLKAHLEEQKAKERGEERRSQIGTGERAEKIRTYNIPQDRITDHRISKNFHNVEAVLDGELDELAETLQKELDDDSR